MRYRIYPYRLYSRSATLLARSLRGGLKVRPDGRYRYRAGDRIINWGNSTVPNWLTPEARRNMLNKPVAIVRASNKLLCLRALNEAGVRTLKWTTDRRVASEFQGRIFARTVLQGHSGNGIVVVDETDQIPDAPLYTEEIENHGEYRVHVMGGRVFAYRKKSRRYEDAEPTEGQSLVRTLGNGWIFRRGELRRLDRVENLAIDAINAVGLDFGAVDIIMDENGDVFVLEINTAVGLSDSTLTEYVEAIENYYG